MGGGDRWRASRVKKEQRLGAERESINQTYGVIAGGVTLRPPPHHSRGDWSAEWATEGSERREGRACAGNDLQRRRAAHGHVFKITKRLKLETD